MVKAVGVRAAELGIDGEYFDARGVLHTVPEETLERLIAAIGPARGGTTRLQDGAQPLLWRHGRSEPLIVWPGIASFSWELRDGMAAVGSGQGSGGAITFGADVPVGAFTLMLRAPRKRAISRRIVVAPATAFQPDAGLADRMWVLAVQLYGVRSARNWGMGDFTDLRDLVRLAAAKGAAGVGLNPLHALFDDRPDAASPYSPNSRLFLNTLYIDLEAVPELPVLDADIRNEITALRESIEVDYRRVGRLKVECLRAAYERFRKDAPLERRRDFESFRLERGLALSRFAAFEVLRRRYPSVWWQWPEEWRHPDDKAIERLRAEAGDDFGYYEYAQWIADRQLAACRDEAQRLGLPIGLYIDLAVGMEPGGAEAWSAQTSIVEQVEVGAPPDLLNTAGQAWGLTTYSPRALERETFAPYAALLDATMRHAGAIRLDHVLGLNRLYLIPFGMRPQDGAYVRYPLQAMLAVTALESERNRCAVIGEDLGTVPDELRAVLADWGVWSYLVMLFERDASGAFLPPEHYKRNALVTFATHDLPTFAGWTSHHDLRVKRGLGLDPGETEDDRNVAFWKFGEALAASGVSIDRAWEFLDAARFLARSPSRIMVVAIEDVLGVIDQPNVPGTIDEHPNWRQRLPVVIEDLQDHAALSAVAQVMAEEGRALPPSR